MNKDSALVIVDVQSDFCIGGALTVAGSEGIFEAINAISPLFQIVVATKDWHPSDHISFASNHSGSQIYDTISVSYGEQVLWPDHCVRGTVGASLHPLLERGALSMVLHKGTDSMRDSYSAFTESDGISLTGLAGYLRAHEIEHVFIGGLATDFCVLSTALDARKNSFQTTVVTDAISAVNIPVGSEKRALAEMRRAGVRFCTSADIVAGV